MAKSAAKVSSHLERAIKDLLKEVSETTEDDKGKKVFKHSLTDRCKVIDRALKLEAIKMKADDSGYGTGFGDDKPEDDS